MMSIAMTYCGLGQDNQQAERLHKENIEKQKAVLGEDHPDTILSLMNLANAYKLQFKLKEAKEIYEEIVDKQTRTFGATHPNTQMTKFNLAIMSKMNL